MSAVKIINLLYVLFIFINNVSTSEKVVVCYYGTWATYRPGLGRFDVSDINPHLCTHVIYAFVGISSKGDVISLDPYLDLAENWGRDNFSKFTSLKQKNPKLKTMMAVGGWNEGSKKYSIMAASANYRQIFIKSLIDVLSQYNFDGFDIDWEYPNRRDTVHGPADVVNFSILLKEMRQEFDKHGYLLTAAVSAVKESASMSYDIPTISKYLDYIHIMAYDMHGAWDAVTGHNAALHKSETDKGSDRKSLFTVDVALEYWLDQGCPPEKIVLGVPFYGRTFKLTNANANSVRAPASGPGLSGRYTGTNGFIGYNEFCKKLQTESWTLRYDALAKVPYAFRDENWVSFDNPDSIRSKVNFGLSNNIAGIMVWSIETDDFNNVCGGGDFPMLRAINEVLNNHEANITEGTSTLTTFITTSSNATDGTTTPFTTRSTTIANSTIKTSTAATTIHNSSVPDTSTSFNTINIPETASGIGNSSATTAVPMPTICKKEGYEADPTDCSCFYMCIRDICGHLTPIKFICPGSLHWDKNLLVCNYPNLTECNV